MIEKVKLRMHMRGLRANQFSKSIDQKSDQILDHICQMPLYQKAQRVGLYDGQAHEVQTKNLLRRLLQDQKEAWLPKVKTGELLFGQVKGQHDLAPGFKDILEPKHVTADIKLDLLLIPCVAVDRWGRRLGQGGGYYDRYLSDYQGTKIALAFDFQFRPLIPFEAHDINVDYVVTDKRVIHCF